MKYFLVCIAGAMQNRKAVFFAKEIKVQNKLFYLCSLKDNLAYCLVVFND